MARAVVCLSICLSVCLGSSSHISIKMNQSINSLLQHYPISDDDRYNGKPVFSKDLLGSKMEDWGKRVFMVSVLEAYEKLLGQMLSEPPLNSSAQNCSDGRAGTGPLAHSLCFVLRAVRDLRRHHYRSLEPDRNKLLGGLQAVQKIQEDIKRRVVWSKALWELQWLYQEASSLVEKRAQRRRRRRQAQRVKNPQRG
ncbi:interferon gamma-like [Myripristis murdjan]|uniref:interferon gamma-like n=1 Tax=Myripristis murdjan TaxID=586833 RepID=UPI0011761058|nr:interferon gamma-like [Myripristis murdjan]